MKKIAILFIIGLTISCQTKNESIDNDEDQKNSKKDIREYRDKDGRIEKILEYVDVCGTKYLNQGWYFDEQGDTVMKNSNFYKVKVSHGTLKPNELCKIEVYYKPLMDNAASGLLISRESIDENYCNLKSVPMDTIYFVDNKLEFFQKFKSKGKKNIRGYILEMKEVPNPESGSKKKYDERKVYYDIPLEVI